MKPINVEGVAQPAYGCLCLAIDKMEEGGLSQIFCRRLEGLDLNVVRFFSDVLKLAKISCLVAGVLSERLMHESLVNRAAT